MTDVAISEIENWVAWCWEGEDPKPQTPARCYSAEGRYVAPAQDDEGRNPQRIINYPSAARVQYVYDRMPQLTRQVLRYEYTQRAAYDIRDHSQEVDANGAVRDVWVVVNNIRRQMARLQLKIGAKEYHAHVEAFKEAVREEFSSEVCA